MAEGVFRIEPAREQDVPLLLQFVQDLADYEELAHEVEATEALLRQSLFGPAPAAEAVIAYEDDDAVGFALFFRTFSTFLGRPGMYLEDIFVHPEHRGRGYGRRLLAHLAAIAVERGYGRMEWSVLDWNEPALAVYRRIGARPMSDWTVHRLTGDGLRRLAAVPPPSSR